MSKAEAIKQEVDQKSTFDLLFNSHHEAVFRYCVRRLGLSDAEDAAADVFAIAWRRLDHIPLGDSTRSWLIGVAYKVVGNKFRSRQRRIRLVQRIESDPSAHRGDSSSEAPEIQLIHLALEKLSSTDRELIRLSSWDGLSRSEIGDVLGIRINAVDQRLHRARGRLKTQFDQLTAANQAARPEEAPI